MKNTSLIDAANLKKIIPVAIGYFSYGTTFGVLAKASDFRIVDVLFQSGFVYAGTAQFASLTFMNEPFVAIFVTTLVINFRYLIINLSTLQNLKMNGCTSPIKKALTLLYNSDETFVLEQGYSKEEYQSDLALKVNLACACLWVTFTAVGFHFARFIPEELNRALTFAIPLIFLCFLRNYKKICGFRRIVLSTSALFLALFPLFGVGLSMLLSSILVGFEFLIKLQLEPGISLGNRI